jgi:hypothetical protein
MDRMPVAENRPGVATRPSRRGHSACRFTRVNDYDSFAEAYTAQSDAGIINAYYERPAILALAGTWPAGGSSTPIAARAPCSRRCATEVPS